MIQARSLSPSPEIENTDPLKDPYFRSEFWNWFDSLPVEEKMKFHSYPHDTAEIFFYNRFYAPHEEKIRLI